MTDSNKKNKYLHTDDHENADGEGTTGQTGAIEFVDFLSTSNPRDDLDTSEQKRLLNLHDNANETSIKKTKELVENREKLKNEKNNNHMRSYGNGSGDAYQATTKYDTHPIVNFDGADPQTSRLPNNQETVANSEAKERHEYQNRPQHTHQPRPAFNPKPMMP